MNTCTYINFPYEDTAIAVETADYESHTIIGEHAHAFQEFVLITKGACMHQFRGIEMPLIAGDVFLIPPHQTHSYVMNSQIHFINCYFYPEQLGAGWADLMKETIPGAAPSEHLEELRSQWAGLLADMVSDTSQPPHQAYQQKKAQLQGIIHLNQKEMRRGENLLSQIEDEQNTRQFGSEYVKASLLQVVLVAIKRAQLRQPQVNSPHSTCRRELIEQALAYMDEHYQDKLNTASLSHESGLSESYFRTLFKDVTGLTPLEYITRLRIIKSLEFIQRDGVTIRQAAEMVGIYDPNYFTRMFKKVMGYPPRYFKKI